MSKSGLRICCMAVLLFLFAACSDGIQEVDPEPEIIREFESQAAYLAAREDSRMRRIFCPA
ncbi:MAG: hypothetical protein WBM68_00820 [Woeseia sp.]